MKVFLGIALFVVGCVALEFEENDGIGLHEGDIKLTPLQQVSLDLYGDPTRPHREARGLTSDPTKLWPRTVPYVVSSELENITEAMNAINAGIQEWEERSCLKFVRRTNEKDYIEMFIGSGCWSYVGRVGGRQLLSLKSGCWSTGTVAHEIAHAMGIWHEQSRPDRDHYVNIVWENIPIAKQHNFRKYNRTQVDSLGVAYDYLSVMHYSATAFSSNGNATIVAVDPNAKQLGQRVGLSPSDVKQIDLLYKCNGATTRPPTPPSSFAFPKGAEDTCNFDKTAGDSCGTCGFTNDGADDFDWTQRIGKTPSGNTGPPADHSTGRWGWFMYIETSSPRVKGERAVLSSKVYPPSDERCFHFFYHMLGKHIGNLTVDVMEIEDGTNDVPQVLVTWKRCGNQGNAWHRADIQLPEIDSKYRILFTGVRGDGYQGDIAIDDVYFTDGKCRQSI